MDGRPEGDPYGERRSDLHYLHWVRAGIWIGREGGGKGKEINGRWQMEGISEYFSIWPACPATLLACSLTGRHRPEPVI